MSKIPEQVKEFFTTHLAYVATSDKKGVPNVVPKGDMAILDDDQIVFADLYSHQTKKNLLENPKIAITAINPAGYKGYQIKGTAKIVERGREFDRLFEKAVGYGQLSHPDAKYAVKIKVSQIIDVSYGKGADKEVH